MLFSQALDPYSDQIRRFKYIFTLAAKALIIANKGCHRYRYSDRTMSHHRAILWHSLTQFFWCCNECHNTHSLLKIGDIDLFEILSTKYMPYAGMPMNAPYRVHMANTLQWCPTISAIIECDDGGLFFCLQSCVEDTEILDVGSHCWTALLWKPGPIVGQAWDPGQTGCPNQRATLLLLIDLLCIPMHEFTWMTYNLIGRRHRITTASYIRVLVPRPYCSWYIPDTKEYVLHCWTQRCVWGATPSAHNVWVMFMACRAGCIWIGQCPP